MLNADSGVEPSEPSMVGFDIPLPFGLKAERPYRTCGPPWGERQPLVKSTAPTAENFNWTFDDPLYRVIVLRGIAWAARQKDVNRLVELAPVGARLTP